MLSKGCSNQVLAAWREGHDPNAPVFGALDPADKAFRDETVHGNADRTWGEIDDRAYRIDEQSTLMEQCLQHAEIRVSKSCSFDSCCRVAPQGPPCLQLDR